MLGPIKLEVRIRSRSMTFRDYVVLVSAVGTGMLLGAAVEGAARFMLAYGLIIHAGPSKTGLTLARLLMLGIALPRLNRSVWLKSRVAFLSRSKVWGDQTTRLSFPTIKSRSTI